MPELNEKAILSRMRALRSRTTERGCTEAEAIAAAEMLSRLSAQYNIALAEIDVPVENNKLDTIQTGRSSLHESGNILKAIAEYTDIKVWKTRTETGIIISFFGAPNDVENARWLYDLCRNSLDTELSTYKLECLFSSKPTGRRQSHAFLMGMVARLAQRLREMKREQTATEIAATGRDLVLDKRATLTRDLIDRGVYLRPSKKSSHSDADAYQDGMVAANSTLLNQAITT